MNGFARLALAGNTLRVEYVDLRGEVVFDETWKTENGQLTRTDCKEEAALTYGDWAGHPTDLSVREELQA